MNELRLSGSLGRDAEVKYVGDKKTPMAKITVATNDKISDDKPLVANFHPVTLWGKMAEQVDGLKKGTPINITGRMVSGSYMNKEGVKVFTYDCTANSVELPKNNNNVAKNDEEDSQLPF